MPIIKSAIKRAKQAVGRRSRNLQVKRAVKQDTQAVLEAVTAGDVKAMQSTLSEAYSEIDRAVKKHTLHKNTAARRKAQLAAAVTKSGAGAVEAKPLAAKGAGKAATAKKATAKKTPAAKKPVAKKAPAKKTTEK